MSKSWKIAAVQMDCKLGDLSANREAIRSRLHKAADQGARLIVFPECMMTGYGVTDRKHALALSEPLPGPTVESLAVDCKKRDVTIIYGMIERDGEKLYNSCALVGPNGYIGSYRKIHLPCVGADRFTDPGDKPFAVHDLGGLKIGVNICFDGSFPESSRIMALAGADLVVLPTNWADKARKMAMLVPQVRAFENHIYYLAVNRVGDESGFHYIGVSSISDYLGSYLQLADHDREEILVAEIDPEAARKKKVVHCVGEYEIDRVNWRRPELYGPLAEGPRFEGHFNK